MAEFKYPRLVAEIWQCGDLCECRQPQVDLVVQRKVGSTTVYDRYAAWEGDFQSEPSTEEFLKQDKQLQEAMRRLGIPREEPFDFGSRAATLQEIAKYMREDRKSMGPRSKGVDDDS